MFQNLFCLFFIKNLPILFCVLVLFLVGIFVSGKQVCRPGDSAVSANPAGLLNSCSEQVSRMPDCFGRKHQMKKLVLSAMLAALVLGANYTLANTTGQTLTRATAEASTKLKLNQASVEQLTAIPGLGKVKAQAILDHISEHGEIKSQAELTKVKGIGDKLAAKVAEYVSFE
ncbi:hypothetical protein AEST_30740 [Alishewanella aestuarii B11]|uniref:Helix-hairpin-helix DNA-binding motif class 1 domain-containing protein n=2 Tax=Alishewanella aestuarii TaxID=453835 RepID=J1Y906_9ALTE|nr:hypothetical protein AEST_30740 [Alishewanella aestuarii B11]